MRFVFKNYKFFLLLCFLVLGVLLTNYFVERKNKFDLDIELVDSLHEQDKYFISFCGFNLDGEYYLEEIEISSLENIYQIVFEFYNIKRNSLPANCIIPSSSLMFAQEFIVDGETLTIVLMKDNIPLNEYERIFKAMKVTYFCLGIKTLRIQHNELTIVY